MSFTRAYLWLVACYGVVLLSFWVLWKISFWALAIYLGRRNIIPLTAPCASQLTVWGFRCRGGDVLDSQCDGQGASSPPALPPALPCTSSAWPAYHAHSRACTRR